MHKNVNGSLKIVHFDLSSLNPQKTVYSKIEITIMLEIPNEILKKMVIVLLRIF